MNTGTNISPAFNYISYQGLATPALTINNAEPSDIHADVAKIYIGSNTAQVFFFDTHSNHNDKFIDQVYDRFDDDGAIYKSGFISIYIYCEILIL